MHDLIPSHPTHDRIDSTKLDTYMGCARKYFYNYVLGWRSDAESYHLLAGKAIHLAMEHMLWKLNADGGYTKEARDEAYSLFLTEYRRHFSEIDDDTRAPKDPASVSWMLDEYIRYYKDDAFETSHTEIAGHVPLSDEGHDIWFNIDAIVEDHSDGGALKIIDHKTASRFDRTWARKWAMTIQFGAYTHAMRCIFGDDFWGVIVNGLCPSKQPRLKKDGTVYATDIDKTPKFLRVNVRYPATAHEAWYMDVMHHYAELLEDHRRLAECRESDPVMVAFPRRYTQCASYGGCPFLPFCTAWDNPLQQCQKPPIGYKVERWDPKERLDTAKTVVKSEGGLLALAKREE